MKTITINVEIKPSINEYCLKIYCSCNGPRILASKPIPPVDDAGYINIEQACPRCARKYKIIA